MNRNMEKQQEGITDKPYLHSESPSLAKREAPLHRLHNTIGNQAVKRLFQAGSIQAKLKVGTPNDKYEQEADRVASSIVRMAELPNGSNSETPVARSGIQQISSIAGGTNSLMTDLNLNQGIGQPLSPSTRQYMEPRFGVDFSNVRIHTDSKARQNAAQIQAKAFTYGNHIWLGKGETEQNRSLMAHELTHTVQQGFIGKQMHSALPNSPSEQSPAQQSEAINSDSKENVPASNKHTPIIERTKLNRLQPKIQRASNVDVAIYETKDHGTGYEDAPSEPFKLKANSIKQAGTKLNAFIKAIRKMFSTSSAIKKLSFYGHAAPGSQSVGAGEGYDSSKEISTASIDAYPDDYKQIYKPLSNGANVYLRGCNAAAGTKGLNLLKKIKTSCKTLTGKDIEAHGWTGTSYHMRVLAYDWYKQTGQRVSSSDTTPKTTWEKLKKQKGKKK